MAVRRVELCLCVARSAHTESHTFTQRDTQETILWLCFYIVLLQLLASIFVQKEDINSSGRTSYKNCYIIIILNKERHQLVPNSFSSSKCTAGDTMACRSEKEEKSIARVRELKMKDRLSKETT